MASCSCVYSGKECQLLKRSGQTKKLDIPVTVLPNINNEQLLSVTLDFTSSTDKMTE
jgi:hypothetical protein